MANARKAKTRNNGLRLIIMLTILFMLCSGVLVWLIIEYNKKLEKEDDLTQQPVVTEQVTEPVVSEEEPLPESSISEEITADPSQASESSSQAESSAASAAESSSAESKDESDDSSSDDSSEPEGEKKMTYSKEVSEKLDSMTLHEKICQMFIVTPEGISNYNDITEAGESTLYGIQSYPVGGVIYFDQNLVTMDQTREMIETTQGYSESTVGLPMFISVDEEGGDVARCADMLGTAETYPMYSYNADEQAAYDNAFAIASDISSLGFNLDFAPVADTWSNPDNTVIGTRAYSDDFNTTAELMPKAVKGFNDGGVYCTLKHFPGHGDTAEDSHYSSAVSYKTVEELENEEYLAFKSGIKAGAQMVMVGHITVPAIDDEPACISYDIVTGELREKLGFNGVVITDSLAMGAVADYYSSGELAVKAVQAGVDILLMPEDLPSAVAALEAAVEDGTISEKRINESAARIIDLKLKMK